MKKNPDFDPENLQKYHLFWETIADNEDQSENCNWEDFDYDES